MTVIVGLSYWGYCERLEDCTFADTPDGHRFGRPLMVDELIRRGYRVISLQQKREAKAYPGLGYNNELPDIDILFVEWRWKTHKNDKTHPKHDPDRYEPDFDRQVELLDFYHGKIPIIVWDTDLQITEEDEKRWPEMIIADPSFKTNRLTRDRVFVPFWSDFKTIFAPVDYSYCYGYVGNNYNRKSQFDKYYGHPAGFLRNDNGIETLIHGNWLERSPERDPPSEMIRAHPSVAFGYRLSFNDSMRLLNRFVCTTHISKDIYSKLGNVTARYFESLMCNTPALVPAEFYKSDILGRDWVVNSPDDVIKKVSEISKMDANQRANIVAEQRSSLMRAGPFSVSHVVNLVEDVIINGCVKEAS